MVGITRLSAKKKKKKKMLHCFPFKTNKKINKPKQDELQSQNPPLTVTCHKQRPADRAARYAHLPLINE